MKVELNPEELRLIVDALDDKHQFQLQSGEGGVGNATISGSCRIAESSLRIEACERSCETFGAFVGI